MRRRHIIAAAAATALMLPLLPATTSWAETPKPIPAGVEKQPSVSTDTNTIIVTFDRNQTDPARAAKDAVERTGATVAKVFPITDRTVTVTLDPAVTARETATIGDQVEGVDGVKAAEPAATFTTGSTNDTYWSYLWNVSPANGAHSVNAETAWPTTTGVGVVVGVIDTGITGHSDLSGTAGSIVGGNLVAGYDFITDVTSAGDGDGRDANPSDAGDWSAAEPSSWHGTHVAGTIAAIRNNNKGVVGVAPGAKVQPIRALGKGGGSESDIIASIYWGAGLGVAGAPTNPTPAKVLNMSIGATTSCSYAMQNAINAAVNAGVTIVVAAGNEGSPVATSMPANCDNVISVAATGPTGAIAEYSNYGTATRAVTIAAPGGSSACSDTAPTACIASTWNSGTTTPGTEAYGLMAGTSMASPHVAAAAAMLKSANPSLTPAQIQTLLTGNTTALASCGAQCGAGLLNVGKAVSAAMKAGMFKKSKSPYTSGKYKKSKKVTAHAGTWSPTATGITYQWLKSGATIPGATRSTYKLPTSMKRKYISVRVTVTRAGYTTTSATSARHKIS